MVDSRWPEMEMLGSEVRSGRDSQYSDVLVLSMLCLKGPPVRPNWKNQGLYDFLMHDAHDVEYNDGLDIIRTDVFDREFAIKWLTGDSWTSTSFAQDEDERSAVMDDTTALLAAFAREAMEEEAVTRPFINNFPARQGEVRVEP